MRPFLVVTLVPSLALVLTGALGLTSCAGAAAEGEAGEGEAGEGEAGEGEAGEGEAGEGEAGEGEGDAGEGEGDAGEGEGDVVAQEGPYGADGDDLVDTFELSVVTDQFHTFTEHVFLPSSTGAHPVVSLSPGLLQPAVAYTTFATRMASHGIAVVVRDDPGAFTQTPDVTADIVYVVDTWLAEQNDDATSPMFGKIDLTRVGLAGHSRGGKASLIAAEEGLHGAVLAWFGLDPVDAGTLADNTFGVTDIDVIGIPVAFLGASVSSSCSPADSNSDVLFAQAVAPAVQLIGVDAGHTQLEDQDQCTGCSFCTPEGTADPDVVLAYTARYITAFFARELQGDHAVGAAFEGAGVAADVDAGLVEVHVK